jgi:hypothetical protein
MTDNITLPRAVGLNIRNSLRGIVNASDDDCGEEKCRDCAPVRVMRKALAALDAALAEPVHPGYVIGSHWLETAYSRIAAGEAEADVLAEVLGERGWAKREPATEKQVAEVFKLSGAVYWGHYRDGWRAAERFHGIRKEDK